MITQTREHSNTRARKNSVFVFQCFSESRGSVLLLTLLLLSFFLFVGLVWATLVFRGLRIIEDTSNAVVAFAAAESGIEEGFYGLQKLNTSFTALNGQSAVLTLSNARWQRNAYDRTKIVMFDVLALGQSVTLDLYSPDAADAQAANFAFGATSLIVTWDTGAQGIIDVSLQSSAQGILGAAVLASLGNGSTVTLDPAKAYRVTLKPNATLRNVRVRATALPLGQGEDVLIPQSRTIESTGSFRGTDQAIRMRIPRISPW